ncbi:hypothetical protein E1211_25385 [Micromonospora sp. 15K316]|uniref:LppU/SCO3897 family protein n=1 Tax=Micromonospora sp. 15K316 TaxID=2530376 RepID=UPI00104D3F4E|nr:hypothetical protein [Micromonospora sp. 15K316]TDC29775.1 hypothetical protein E1211_25385 [Micromonospora sp. 15K316]
MTSEGPHHPGQEPDEVPPGAGGPTPYGDRPAQPANGYGAGPDLGWAPPPPAGPNPTAHGWAAQNDQPPAAWGAAQPPPAADAGHPAPWPATGAPQPAWGGQPEQSGQGWTGAAEQPAWPQSQPAARGAAQVPTQAAPPQAWPQDDPARSGGWTPPQQGDPSPQTDQAGAGWGAPAQPGPANGGWSDGGAQPGQPTPANGWNDGAPQTDQPAWAQAEPAVRGAAQVPAATDAGGWPPQQDTGWSAGTANPTGPADNSGGWGAGAPSQPDQAAQHWGATPESQPQQPDWMLSPAQDQPQDSAPAGGWQEPPADPGRSGGWPAEPTGTPARASASVPGAGALPQRNPGERAGVSEVEPWAPGEAWGNTDADAASRPAERAEDAPIYQPGPAPGISPANVVPLPPQEQRVPGASLAATPPADYAPAADFPPPAPFGATAGQPAPATYGAATGQATTGERGDWPPVEATGQGYAPEQPAWAAEAHPDESPAPAGPVVPAPRTSPESGAAGRTTASAAVPLASRVLPPADQPLRPDGGSTPQPRVYGRPARPEPADEPEQAQPDGYGADARPEAAPRFDDRELPAPPNGYAEPAPVSSGPPAPPAFPPGVPTFVDAPNNTRPVNGNRPHPGERPADPFGSPVPHDPGMPPVAGYGPPALPDTEPAPTSTFPSAFPPPPQQPAVPAWGQGGPAQPGSVPSWGQNEAEQHAAPNWTPGAPEADQSRFDAFKPDAEPKSEPPPAKVRNGRVLAAVLTAAVLILAVPLGLLFLLGKVGGDQAPSFDPAVGTCVKKSGETAVAADCGEAEAFTVVSKVDNKDKCGDPSLPHVVLQGDGPNRVLCLKPAAAGQ